MSKEHDEMKLPEGKTCGDCTHFEHCSRMVGAAKTWTNCDYYPIRFALNTRLIGLTALLKAKETIKALHGDIAWDIYDRSSPEMKQINAAIEDLSA